jgi:hypothetical protein
MANVVKVQALYGILKSGSPIKFDHILTTMGVNKGTAMCLICALRNDYGANINTVRDGRQVSDYVLTNAEEIFNRINSAPVKGAKKNSTVTKATKTAKTAKPAKVSRVVQSAVKKTAVKVKDTSKSVEDDGSVPVLDADMEIYDISDSELEDIKSQLGLA